MTITDPMHNITSEGYGSGGTYVATTYPTSNGSSNISTKYADTLGRQYDTQTQDGSSYDTTTTFRNWTLPYFNIVQTMPCSVTAAKGTCSTAKAVTTSYDALGRKLSVTDANSLHTSYSYFPKTVSGNNVVDVVVAGPAKSNQYEYDTLGRLLSVCEISARPGSGACGQANPQNGFLTSYTSNIQGQITKVVQGQEVRTFKYDAVGRLLLESNPESGTTTYTWDSSTTACPNAYFGHLVQKQDANGNTSCLNYDLFGRLTSATYSGPNAGASSYFIYDAATYGSTAMTYARGHVAEAYTCTTCPGTKITDEFFSYNQRGELTDVWEKTPHSPSAYYHTTASFYPNHSVASLTVPGPTTSLSWALDSKGRPYSATANSGAVNLVGSTLYDPADRPLTINLGLGDQDTYVYDNGERMKNFTFTVGSSGTSVAGILTWDPSTGALSTLKVTDGWNSAASETCNYGYNDMAQVTSVACGSLWSQTFSTDAYGNLIKSGSLTFSPGYDPTTNRYTSLLNAKYDNNGNLTNDGTNGYSFDSNNLVATVVTTSGTNGITRDAFGRMAEIASPAGTYTEILYSALGRTAKMSGNNVQNIFAPLTGGAKLEVKGTIYVFHHKDWLGTSRFISYRGNRNLFFDAAYAPFGESYSTSGTTDLNFTGQRQDIVAGLYDFQYREYIPNHGRWLSPDPSGLRAVDPTNPQTWNRYAYVTNNPLSAVDPMGLEEEYGNADEAEITGQDGSMDPPDIGSILADSGANDSGAATMNDILNSPQFDQAFTPDGMSINAMSSAFPLLPGSMSTTKLVAMDSNQTGTLNIGPLVDKDFLHNSAECPQCGQMIANSDRAVEALSSGFIATLGLHGAGKLFMGASIGAQAGVNAVGGPVGAVGGAIGGGSAAASELMGPLSVLEGVGIGWAEFGWDLFTPAPYTPPNP
jgi:RHS repeat-associated protein